MEQISGETKRHLSNRSDGSASEWHTELGILERGLSNLGVGFERGSSAEMRKVERCLVPSKDDRAGMRGAQPQYVAEERLQP